MEDWSDRQRAFAARLGARSISEIDSGTIVVVPSITFPAVELAKIAAAQLYEQRLLFLLLLLRSPGLRLVYVTALPVDPVIVDYYLRFLPDPSDARARLSMVTLDDPSNRALSVKVLDRPDVVDRVRALAGDPDDACVLTFNVTVAERAVSSLLGLPLYGPPPELVPLGSKSGSRQVARRAGVAVLDGAEDLFSLAEVDAAVAALRHRRPSADAVVVKLNNGFSGQGSVMVSLPPLPPLPPDAPGVSSPSLLSSPTVFCAAEESWTSFSAKVAAEGAIVEELVLHPGVVSPSVQLHASPVGSFEVVSTHDQILGGPGNQVYIGCSFPARPDYRLAIQEAACRVAAELAAEGVVGSFGIDFLVVPSGSAGAAGSPGPDIYLSEINLRMGGTTHPFWMARLATGGRYDAASGELVAGGRAKSYVATDNIKSQALVGRSPGSVIEAVDRAGLGFDPATGTGVTLHLLGAVPGFGKLGLTAIADSPEASEELYRRVTEVVVGPG